MEEWLKVLAWIQLVLTLVFLVFLIGVLMYVLRYYHLEFNGFWKTRAGLVLIGIMWTLSLLLGRQQLWRPSDGLLSVSDLRFRGLCRAHVFLAFGIWQPLFFLVILMLLRSKARSKLQLYAEDPNKDVLRWSLTWDIIILALSNVHESNPIVWSTYQPTYHQCVIPVISIGAFAIFYACFIIFYGLASGKLFTRLINRSLRTRIRWTQLFFVFFFPFEVFVRFVMLFVPKYEKAFEALYHTYFFMDLIVCAVGVTEFVLRPVLDAASFPLEKGVTAEAVQEYIKSEEEKIKKRRFTKGPAMNRVLSDIQQEALLSKVVPPPPSSTHHSEPKIASDKIDAKLDSNSNNHSSSSISSISISNNNNNHRDEIKASDSSTTTPRAGQNMNVTLTTAHVEVDDVFADIDDLDEAPTGAYGKDSSLGFKLEGISLDEFHS